MLGGAAKEVGKMLQDYVIHRFQETKEYQEIDMLLPPTDFDDVSARQMLSVERRG